MVGRGVWFLLFFTLCIAGLVWGQSCSTCLRGCTFCGNGRCDYPAETCSSCPADCGVCPNCTATCGNLICEISSGESACSCPEDCGVCCIDGMCNAARGENYGNCPQDCSVNFSGTVINSETRALLDSAVVTCTQGSRVLGPVVTSSGSWSFGRVAPGGYVCSAQKNLFDPYSITFNVGANGTQVTIPLDPQKGSITGLAFDADTFAPLLGVNVFCNSSNYVTGRYSTDAGGNYYYVGVIPGLYDCQGTLAGYSAGFRRDVVPAGGHQRFDLYLRALQGQITGMITSNLGLPIRSVTVTCKSLAPKAENVTVLTFSNVFGNYLIDAINSGPASCTAEKFGFSNQTKTGIVPRGSPLVLNFTMEQLPSTLVGTVSDGLTGLAVPAARVDCNFVGALGNNATVVTVAAATTIQNGSYAVNPIAAGGWACTASADGYTSRTSSIFIPAAKVTSLPFILEPLPSSIFGKVTTRIGGVSQFVAGATVSCEFTTQPNLQPSLGPALSNSSADYLFQNIIVQSTLKTLTFLCRANRDGFGSGSKTGTLVRGQTVQADIELVIIAIRITVREVGTLNLISDATATCFSNNNTFVRTTNDQGLAAFDAIPAGTYNCSATKPRYTTDVRPGIQVSSFTGVVSIDLYIEIQKFPVEGVVTVFNYPQIPTPNALIRISNATSGEVLFSARASNASGYWTTRLALPGRFLIEVENGVNFDRYRSIRDLTFENTRRPLNLQIVALASVINGTILSDTVPGPLAGASVTIVETTTEVSSGRPVITEADGAYSFPQLGPGIFRITAALAGYNVSNVFVTIPTPGLTIIRDITLVFIRTGTISGSVFQVSLDGSRRIAAGVVVTITAATGQVTLVTTGPDGKYSAEVDPGTATVRVTASGFDANEVTLPVLRGTLNTAPELVLTPRTGIITGVILARRPDGTTVNATAFDSILICIYPFSYTGNPTSDCPGSINNDVVENGSPTSRYEIPGIPEGQNRLFAFSSLEVLEDYTSVVAVSASRVNEFTVIMDVLSKKK